MTDSITARLKSMFSGFFRRTVVILSTSGKGGAGKTSLIVNVASVLARKGYRVGMIDGDVSAPNVLRMLGLPEGLDAFDPGGNDRKMKPNLSHEGVMVISTASIFSRGAAISWSDKEIKNFLIQCIADTDWGRKLDYLFIDMAPSTTGAFKYIDEIVPRKSNVVAIVTTTPMKVSIDDCTRLMNTAVRNSVDILGVVENMSLSETHCCSVEAVCGSCGKPFHPFGDGSAGSDMAARFNVKYYGSIKFNPRHADSGDRGTLSLMDNPVVAKVAFDLEDLT